MTTATIQDTAQGLSLRDNLIGRDIAGNKYFISVEIKPVQGNPAQDIYHQPITGAPVLRISGVIISKYGSLVHDRGWISAGQCLDDFKQIRQFANRWSVLDLVDILAIWREYHLNEMTSHCAHQDKAIKWDTVDPCTVTGYRAGSAWLYSPLPDSVLITLTGLILKHKSDGSSL